MKLTENGAVAAGETEAQKQSRWRAALHHQLTVIELQARTAREQLVTADEFGARALAASGLVQEGQEHSQRQVFTALGQRAMAAHGQAVNDIFSGVQRLNAITSDVNLGGGLGGWLK